MKRILLVVDDELEICRMIEKTLESSFDSIHIATSTAEAEPVLASQPVTHLIIDLYLGKDEPLGHEVAREWRARLPSIQYAALFTGSTADMRPEYSGIDAIFQKPSGYLDLINRFKAGGV